MDSRRYYVHILASKSRRLYIGITGFLMARVLQHKAGENASFTRRYNINRLVYYESFRYVNNALSRETYLKTWSRQRKVALIEGSNPLWNDLAEGWGELVAMEKQIPTHALAIAPRSSE
jgi:putative endonuclease